MIGTDEVFAQEQALQSARVIHHRHAAPLMGVERADDFAKPRVRTDGHGRGRHGLRHRGLVTAMRECALVNVVLAVRARWR